MPLYLPLYLKMNTSADKAKAARHVVERLLSTPMVRMLLKSHGVEYESILVSDPVDQDGRPV